MTAGAGYAFAALFGMVVGLVVGVGMGYESGHRATVAETPIGDPREE
jgi:hypothetical protein